LKAGEVSQPVQLKDGVRILKLVAREAPGQRGIGDPRFNKRFATTLKNRKEQLLKAAYLATVRDEAKVTIISARQVIEAAGRLPEAAKTSFPSKQGTPAKLVFSFLFFSRNFFSVDPGQNFAGIHRLAFFQRKVFPRGRSSANGFHSASSSLPQPANPVQLSPHLPPAPEAAQFPSQS